jgi:choloylglycine hydrolase
MPKKKILSVALAMSLSMGFVNNSALACSRVLLNAGNEHVVARTFDLYMTDNPQIVANPRGMSRNGDVADNAAKWTAKYGSVIVLSFGKGASDGMNEKGLVGNLLYLHETQYETRDNRPGVSNVAILQYLLDTSATVNEALAELKNVQVVSGAAAGREWPLHISISDAHGDSAVIEFIDGKMVVHHGKESDVMTNEPALSWQLNNLKKYKYFGGKEALPGDIDPASRFVRASAFLKTAPNPKDNQEALAEVYSIIKTVSVPYGADNTATDIESEDKWPTLWTTLADSSNKRYFFQASDSPNMFWVDMSKINFAKGAPVLATSAEDITLNGEVSKRLKPVK